MRISRGEPSIDRPQSSERPDEVGKVREEGAAAASKSQSSSDRIEISARARSLHVSEQVPGSSHAGLEAARFEAIRNRIAAGGYDTDAVREATARKLLEAFGLQSEGDAGSEVEP